MPPRTVTISLPPAVASDVDRLARSERRTRSELLREAFRQYAARADRLERAFEMGERAARRLRVREDDVPRIVREYRRSKVRA